jgi:FkbM family methyltransferase
MEVGAAAVTYGFPARFTEVLADHLHPVHARNADGIRHPDLVATSGRLRESIATTIARAARQFGFCDTRGIAWPVLADIWASSAEVESAWTMLADNESRDLFLLLLAYRVLGHRRVRLPVYGRYHAAMVRAGDAVVRAGGRRQDTMLGALDEFDLTPIGRSVILQCHRTDIVNTFLLEQYRFARNGRVIAPSEGDVIIDCGGCWGDSALYFAGKAGATGGVFSYEFEPGNLEIFRHNMELNEDLARRIRVVERAVWREPDVPLSYTSNSVATAVSAGADGDRRVLTDTIDALAERERLSRVDFVKMDIEGAELAALSGARATLVRDRPRLAISVYHRPADLWQIPAFIDALGLGYRFYLDHFTIYDGETVLFCEVPVTEPDAKVAAQ